MATSAGSATPLKPWFLPSLAVCVSANPKDKKSDIYSLSPSTTTLRDSFVVPMPSSCPGNVQIRLTPTTHPKSRPDSEYHVLINLLADSAPGRPSELGIKFRVVLNGTGPPKYLEEYSVDFSSGGLFSKKKGGGGRWFADAILEKGMRGDPVIEIEYQGEVVVRLEPVSV